MYRLEVRYYHREIIKHEARKLKRGVFFFLSSKVKLELLHWQASLRLFGALILMNSRD